MCIYNNIVIKFLNTIKIKYLSYENENIKKSSYS